MSASYPSHLVVTLAAAIAGVACGTTTVDPPPPPPPTVASVEVSPGSHEFKSINETHQYTATPRASDGTSVSATVNWSSSNTDIATVSTSGLVTAKANGTATITATAAGRNGTASAQVSQAPAKLGMATQPGGAFAGAPLDVQPVVRVLDALGTLVPTDNATSVTAAIGTNPAGASLGGATTRTASGGTVTFTDLTVSAPGAGFTLAFSASNLTAVTSSAFEVHVPVATVQITTTPASMASLGDEQTLTAVARDAQDNPINGVGFVWKTGNAAVATVSSGGVLQAVANGTTSITASAGGVESAPVAVTVQQVAASVEVSPGLAVLRPATQRAVTVTVRDARGHVFPGAPVTPTSRNQNVVTASNSQLSGVNAGAAYVVFTSGSAKDSALAAVTTTDGFAAVASSAAGTSRLTPGTGTPLTVRLFFLRPAGGTGTLGSVQGRLQWNHAHLSLTGSAAGAGFSWFPNTTEVSTGVLRFSAFNAAGNTGTDAEVVVAQLSFNVVGGAGGTSVLDLVIDVAGSAPGATITSLVQVLDAALRIQN